MLSKLVSVVGNLYESDLGLDGDLADVIAKQVDIIVNSAANTTIDERLRGFLYHISKIVELLRTRYSIIYDNKF